MTDHPTRALTVIGGETTAAKVRRLQNEARALAAEHVGALVAAMAQVEVLAREIAGGGDAYSPGARDLARRISEDVEAKGQTLAAINGRHATLRD